jgi:hypothetical protein
MTKARAKTNAIRNAGAKNARRRRDSQSRDLPRGSLTKRISAKTRNPPPASPFGQTAEGLDYRFLRSQPRVIGPGSLRRARPRQSDYNTNTQPKGLIINAPLSALQIYTSAR